MGDDGGFVLTISDYTVLIKSSALGSRQVVILDTTNMFYVQICVSSVFHLKVSHDNTSLMMFF